MRDIRTTQGWGRREVLAAAGAVAAAGLTAPSALASARRRPVVWTFDRLTDIGGVATRVEGAPKVVDSPYGGAVQFDGVQDVMFVDRHPLAGAKTFSFEALFRPDGGAPAQRWFHLAEGSPAPVSGTRILFEIRTADNQWWLDAFATGPGYKETLIFPDKRFPVGQWHHVAQTYDGETYRSFVNGQLQGEAKIAFTPQGPGSASVGARINKVDFFRGAVRQARFTPQALDPKRFHLGRT